MGYDALLVLFLRGICTFSGPNDLGLVLAWGVLSGLSAAALAPEETDIAPPLGISQVESLAWRKPKPCRSVQSKL